MLGFMDYVQRAFAHATGWDYDNSYASLTTTSRNILEFNTPQSLRLDLSSLASGNFASSYSIGSTGLLDGSISYLYTSKTLQSLQASSNQIPLRDLILGYRQLQPLSEPEEPHNWEIWHQGKRIDRRDTLLYGRLYLPASILEGLYIRRLSPTSQLKILGISDSALSQRGIALAHLERNTIKYHTNFLFSTDSALFGIQLLYNFGQEGFCDHGAYDSSTGDHEVGNSLSSKFPHGRFSAGGEIYYGLLNKSGGLSTGLRFVTLPSYTGFPYSMSLTLNPLMGGLSSTYSVVASPLCTLSSHFDFNFYSYESNLQLGTELWRASAQPSFGSVDWVRRRAEVIMSPQRTGLPDGFLDTTGCLKAKINQRGVMTFLWESRLKSLLYSAGVTIDFRGGENLFNGLGLLVQYSP